MLVNGEAATDQVMQVEALAAPSNAEWPAPQLYQVARQVIVIFPKETVLHSILVNLGM